VKKTGTITLFNERGICLAKNRYHSPSERRYVIEGWRSLFKPKFSEYYFQIKPDIHHGELEQINLLKAS
jgi:hypothetical protein